MVFVIIVTSLFDEKYVAKNGALLFYLVLFLCDLTRLKKCRRVKSAYRFVCAGQSPLELSILIH